MQALLFNNETLKRVAHNVIYVSATPASLVDKVTDTDCHTQHVSAHNHVLMTFNYQFLTKKLSIFHETISQLKTCCGSIVDSIPVDRAGDASLLWVPFKLSFPFKLSSS